MAAEQNGKLRPNLLKNLKKFRVNIKKQKLLVESQMESNKMLIRLFGLECSLQQQSPIHLLNRIHVQPAVLKN